MTAFPKDPPTRKGSATRERIIWEAAELIHKQGAAATTVQQVRASAGVSASQLYHYFADKNALVRAVAECQGARMQTGQIDAGIDSLAALRRWAFNVIAAQQKELLGCPLGSLGTELAETDHDGRLIAALGFEKWHQALITGLDRIVERGELPRNTDTRELALGLLAALQGGLLLARVTQDVEPLRSALELPLRHLERLSSMEQSYCP